MQPSTSDGNSVHPTPQAGWPAAPQQRHRQQQNCASSVTRLPNPLPPLTPAGHCLRGAGRRRVTITSNDMVHPYISNINNFTLFGDIVFFGYGTTRTILAPVGHCRRGAGVDVEYFVTFHLALLFNIRKSRVIQAVSRVTCTVARVTGSEPPL